MSSAVINFDDAKKQQELEELENLYENLKEQDYCNERSDNRYFSSGRASSMRRQINEVSNRIKELKNEISSD